MKILINKYYFVYIIFILNTIYGTLIFPENESRLNYIHILFEWEQVPDAVSYNLKVSNDLSFDSLLLNINEVSTVYIDKENFSWENIYYWTIIPNYDCQECENLYLLDTLSFEIGNEYSWDIEIDINDEIMLSNGLLAIGAFIPDLESIIIDKNGKEVWNDGELDFMINHINNNGNIYGFSSLDYPLNTGMRTNIDLEFIWSTLNTEPVDLHEFKQIPNGNYMGFINEYRQGPIPEDNYMTEYFRIIGYQADGITSEFPWYGQKIVEWNTNHEIVWSWDPFEYFSMSDYDNYEGTWYNAWVNQEHDWMHSNAFHFDDVENVLYVSHRHLSRITKIAYPSGEVIWNMGLPAEYMSSGDQHICTDLLFSFQHNIQLLDNGDLIFFDNGNLSDMLLGDEYPTSRIRRVKVIDNSYCKTIWQYDLPLDLHGLGMGSVQLLDNGNYSIYTFGSGLNDPEPSVIEVTPEKEIIWKMSGDNNVAWYRSYEIPELHSDAFSVIAQNYISNNNINSILIIDDMISFSIYNNSSYHQQYKYIFSDLIDSFVPMFLFDEGEISIEPYSSFNLSFITNDLSNIDSTQVLLSIWPAYHENSIKELQFSISRNNILNGDINNDNIVNILDIIALINIILNFNDDILEADLNGDAVINILDVILLVNNILEE